MRVRTKVRDEAEKKKKREREGGRRSVKRGH
jgi:hypothetical protein